MNGYKLKREIEIALDLAARGDTATVDYRKRRIFAEIDVIYRREESVKKALAILGNEFDVDDIFINFDDKAIAHARNLSPTDVYTREELAEALEVKQ